MPKAVKLLLHEYAGYAFPAQLARALARRGHDVTLAYFEDLGGPKRNHGALPNDPETLHIRPITIGSAHEKTRFLRRRHQERDYGRKLANLIETLEPELTLLSNTPLDVVDVLRKRLGTEQKLIWWLQDIFGIGIGPYLRSKYGILGDAIGWHYRGLERRFANRADHIILIADDFLEEIRDFGIDPSKTSVIENWAPLEDLSPLPHETAWRREHGLDDKKIILYAGTLGFKHNPRALVSAAVSQRAAGHCDVSIVVVSEGLGAEFLKQERDRLDLNNLLILEWQPYHRLSEVLASANILVALIEPAAARFSVPSKVLSYLCAGRPVIGAIPATNLAARTILRAKAGCVVEPGNDDAFSNCISELLSRPALTEEMGRNARQYAEREFDIYKIADKFLHIMDRVRR